MTLLHVSEPPTLSIHGHAIPFRVCTCHDGGQIESEAVDVHCLYPVPQAIHDEAPDDRMVAVEGVSTTSVVVVFTPRREHVVNAIIKAPAEYRLNTAKDQSAR